VSSINLTEALHEAVCHPFFANLEPSYQLTLIYPKNKKKPIKKIQPTTSKIEIRARTSIRNSSW